MACGGMSDAAYVLTAIASCHTCHSLYRGFILCPLPASIAALAAVSDTAGTNTSAMACAVRMPRYLRGLAAGLRGVETACTFVIISAFVVRRRKNSWPTFKDFGRPG